MMEIAQFDPHTAVICAQPGRYIGWPTVARTETGELLAVFSGDRDWHICPYGKTQLVRSLDDGVTWSEPETITDSPLDDRDAGVIVLKSGTILVNWFTSLAFEQESALKWMRSSHPKAHEVIDRWQRHIAKLTDEDRKKYLGMWSRRSTDGGRTWEDWVSTLVGSPHGPIQLSDGRLLYVGDGQVVGKRAIGAAESRDEGRSWQLIWHKPMLTDECAVNLCELHQAELPDGGIVAMIRYDTGPSHYLWQMESDDGGYTWSVPHITPILGLPPHLLTLRDGRLLVTYGYRWAPFGERACLSDDGGRTWDPESVITFSDAPSGDLGYPASVQLDDDSILSVYYQQEKAGDLTCLMATRWTPPPAGTRRLRKQDGLKVEMSEPTVVALGPIEERRWGFCQFPMLLRTEDGNLVVLNNMADDSHDDAGDRQPSLHYVTRDNGKTWQPLEDLSSIRRSRILSDGTEVETLPRPKRLASELGLSPVCSVAVWGSGQDDSFPIDLYRYEDLPAEMQGLKTRLRNPDGTEETFIAPLKFPGLAVGSMRRTHTCEGWVDLPGNIHPFVFDLDTTACVELPCGTLLYVQKAERFGEEGVLLPGHTHSCLLASEDKGRSWALRAVIAMMVPDEVPWGLHEETLTRLPNGTLICAMRSDEGVKDARHLWITTSRDDGFTWSKPRALNPFGVEPEFLTLANGVTALSYGRPGVELRFSSDEDGEQWSDPYVVLPGNEAEDGASFTSCSYTKLHATGPDRFLIVYSDFYHRDDDFVLHKAIKVREVRVAAPLPSFVNTPQLGPRELL